MGDLDAVIGQRLVDVEAQGLLRRLRTVDSPQGETVQSCGKALRNFSSNDYLALANHPILKLAMAEGIERYGVGAGASRLICGNLKPFVDLEETLASFKGTQAALTFSTGYATALGTVCALVGKDDIVILDKLAHASMIDAARLSRAKLRVFQHNDMNDLESMLKWADGERAKSVDTRPNILVLTETVFSMDGDLAPLRDLVELKDRYGAWLMVDEAHATGMFGEHRRGLAEAMGVSDRVDIQMGTLGKALGVSGGYVAGSRTLVDWLINRARSFVYSTAPSPAVAFAARAAVEFVASQEGERSRQRLWARVNRLKETIVQSGWPLGPAMSPILPLGVGNEDRAVELAKTLLDAGFLIPAIRFPTVPRGEARLRITMTAGHELQSIRLLGEALTSARSPRATNNPHPA